MNNKDNVISMEDYKKRKAREAEVSEAFLDGMPCFPDISVRDLSSTCFRDAPHPTREEMMRMFEDIPPLRFQVKAPKASQPKPWYHWYTQQR